MNKIEKYLNESSTLDNLLKKQKRNIHRITIIVNQIADDIDREENIIGGKSAIINGIMDQIKKNI